MADAKPAFEGAKNLYSKAVKGLKELKWEDVPGPVRKYIEEHPKLSGIQLVLLLVLTCPGLVVTPLLGWIGFSSIGPVAGESTPPFSLRSHAWLINETVRVVCGVVSIFLRCDMDL